MEIHVTVIIADRDGALNVLKGGFMQVDLSKAKEPYQVFNLINKTIDPDAPEINRAEFENFFVVNTFNEILHINFPMMRMQYILTMLEPPVHAS